MGDFNVGTVDSYREDLCDTDNQKNLITKRACYENSRTPTCFNLFLTNHQRSFQSPCVFETGFSDFQKMTLTVMKASLQKLQPRVLNYGDYKHFQNNAFRKRLLSDPLDINLEKNEEGLSNFLEIFKKI